MLTLYMHPFASFCQKVTMALYENRTAFQPEIVDLGDPVQRAALVALWPIGKFPVLRDHERGCIVPESTIIIEYVSQHYPGAAALVPADPAQALEARRLDRFYDLYVSEPMQKIVLDRLRPPGQGDPVGVEQARATLRTAYALIDRDMATRTWALGDAVSIADCSAAPALYYADRVEPIGDAHPHAARYLERLLVRPSFARVRAEAEPYAALFPTDPAARA